MIQSFRCKHTQALFEGGSPGQFRAFENIAIRKLTQLEAAQTLDFLRSPPGNRLEALKGDRQGQHSIRINNQYRVCFTWTENGPANVEIVAGRPLIFFEQIRDSDGQRAFYSQIVC